MPQLKNIGMWEATFPAQDDELSPSVLLHKLEESDDNPIYIGELPSATLIEVVIQENIFKEVVRVQSKQVVSTAQIFSLPDEKYELNQPLLVTLEFCEDEVLASLPDLKIFSEGGSDFEAIKDLKLQILDYYDDLVSSPDVELSSEILQHKRSLLTLITKND